MRDGTEELLEDFIRRNPQQYKVYRNKNGTLNNVYDKLNGLLWCKKRIYVNNNRKRRTTFWMCL